MEVLEVQKCGLKRIEALVNECNCKTLYDIVNVSMDDLKEHLGVNIGPTIYESFINKMKEAPLDVMMCASNCFNSGLIGPKKIKAVLTEIPNILIYKEDLYDKINEIEGFSDKSTEAFIDGLNNFKDFIKEFNEKEHDKNKKNLHDSIAILEPKWNNLRVFIMRLVEDEWIDKYQDSLFKYEMNEIRNQHKRRFIYIINDVRRLEKALDSLIHHFNILLLMNHYMIFDYRSFRNS